MIEYSSVSDHSIERVTSASDGSISLTWLWEVIVRTKHDLDPKILFHVLRDRLRNVEREIRLHALRVLADLVPVIDRHQIDKYMEVLTSDLLLNLSNTAPAIRKGTIDVLRVYLRYTPNSNQFIHNFISLVPDDSPLAPGLLIAVPYFTYHQVSEDTLSFILQRLYMGLGKDYQKEPALASLVKVRSRIGVAHFNNLLGPDRVKKVQELCRDDNVILETEITLENGPAITMKIHEDDALSTDSFHSDSQVTRSPRKVRFGGEVVKMRTPESDTNHTSDDSLKTSVIIDRPTSIKITLSEKVAAIKTRHKSLIPVRVTVGSTPSTPRKKVRPKRHHTSAPELGSYSKIPQPRKLVKKKQNLELELLKPTKRSRGEDALSPVPIHEEIEVFHNLTRSPERSKDKSEVFPVPQELPELSTKFSSFQVYATSDTKTDFHDTPPALEDAANKNFPSFQVFDNDAAVQKSQDIPDDPIEDNSGEVLAPTLEEQIAPKEVVTEKSKSFKVCPESGNSFDLILHDLLHKDDIMTKSRVLDEFVIILEKDSANSDSLPPLEVLSILCFCEKQPRLRAKAQEALYLFTSKLKLELLHENYSRICDDLIRVKPPSNIRLCLLIMKRTTPKKFFESVKLEAGNREAILQALIAAARTFPSSEIDLNNGINLALDSLKDNKRNVRQAALETLATLAQVAGNSIILEAINRMLRDDEDSGQILTVVRTRLSRRQLPIVDLDGNIRYSSPREQEEFDWLCGGSMAKSSSLTSIKVPAANYWQNNMRHFSRNPQFEDESNGGPLPKIPNAQLYPVYVLHSEARQNYKNFDRGRSNSPPKRSENLDINSNHTKKSFRKDERFRKSFSSEQLYNANKSFEPTYYSLSSRSSTTSTGSSTKSGVWFKDFRSGIPVPISAETKLKFRGHRNGEQFSGPLIVQDNRTKFGTPQDSPGTKDLPQYPPPSSGSESSGYFTPPAEHHLKDHPPEVFEENNNFQAEEPNFQIIDSEPEPEAVVRQSSVSSSDFGTFGEKILEEAERSSCLDEVDFVESPRVFVEPKLKSKSEGNLKSTLPEISDRKNINSAPPLNNLVSIVPLGPEVIPSVSLPGSVTSSDTTPTKKVEHPSRRLLRRSLSVRTTSTKRRESAKTSEPQSAIRPKELLYQTLIQLDNSEWEIIIQGLKSLIRLAHNNSEMLEPQLHSICVILAKHIRNLRSQVARAACHAAGEIFSSCKKGLDVELEELAVPLLHRTADTNKFLRSDANAALDAMSLNMSIPRVVAVVASKGATHQNCIVRAASTRLLGDIAMRIGPEKIFQLPKETRDKFLFVGATGLTEGSLDTRRHAKNLLSTLVGHPQFQRGLMEAVPQHTLRHISKIISTLK